MQSLPGTGKKALSGYVTILPKGLSLKYGYVTDKL